MSKSKERCIFCGDSCDEYKRATGSYSVYECENCGRYAISDFFSLDSSKTISTMYYYLLHKKFIFPFCKYKILSLHGGV